MVVGDGSGSSPYSPSTLMMLTPAAAVTSTEQQQREQEVNNGGSGNATSRLAASFRSWIRNG